MWISSKNSSLLSRLSFGDNRKAKRYLNVFFHIHSIAQGRIKLIAGKLLAGLDNSQLPVSERGRLNRPARATLGAFLAPIVFFKSMASSRYSSSSSPVSCWHRFGPSSVTMVSAIRDTDVSCIGAYMSSALVQSLTTRLNRGVAEINNSPSRVW